MTQRQKASGHTTTQMAADAMQASDWPVRAQMSALFERIFTRIHAFFDFAAIRKSLSANAPHTRLEFEELVVAEAIR